MQILTLNFDAFLHLLNSSLISLCFVAICRNENLILVILLPDSPCTFAEIAVGRECKT